MYTINNKEYSFDSLKNQSIKERFVNNNVIANVGTMVEYILSKYDDEAPFSIDDVENQYNEETDTYTEVYEWWLVNSHFADMLAEHGEVVIRDGNFFGCIWGRCSTGQAIALDGIISQLAYEMEILEGQKYEWRV